MGKSKLLFITHEMSPFLDLTKISEITRQLPQAMQDKGFEIRILMPRFGNINERRNRLHEVIRLSGMNIIINDNDNPLIIKVASIPSARMQVYFLDNEEYFQRKHVFADKEGKFYADNDERMIFFCKGAIETVKKLGWSPDIVHCHGWMSALVPVYLKTTYKDDPTFKHSKIVYSVYDTEFTERLDPDFAQKAIMADMSEEHVDAFKAGTNTALDEGAIKFSDAVVVGSSNVDDQVLNYVKNSNKSVLEYEYTSDFENYYNFYDEITNEELVHVA
jgi:starch synthase